MLLLFLVTFLALKYTLYNNDITVSAFFWLMLARYIFLLSFYCQSTDMIVVGVSCKHHIQ